MQGRRSRPKNNTNTRASYLCYCANILHGRKAESENDAQPDLRQKLTPGKHTHSINVQAIVNHQGLITNIVAKYPGSVHDSFIFRHCTINQHFQDGRYGNRLLVADQGYGIQQWIMTPFGNPSTAAERAYHEAHRRTATIVERTFGILKSRFRCLNITGGSLLYSPEMVCKIILTCAILHNICVRSNIPLLEPEPQMPEEEDEEDAGQQHEGDQPNTAAVLRRRQHIVNNFF
ncbi:hypothetical protein NDU88_006941 [Pleurodeles waltl]|uniref:DDE Tnp4 domain-containing protein n=1 Tax=Pleurodeles waltl TaxID=8319 RepID=A0AAV7NTF3_PLEWA|nr:hypothetical protein NDU88_006941 [Pleurodeles waltl]